MDVSLVSGTEGKVDLRGVRALLLVGGDPERERYAGVPMALLDVLGRSPLARTVDRLKRFGIEQLSIISDTQPIPSTEEKLDVLLATGERFWQTALHSFRSLAQQSEAVLIIRLGAWAEVDYGALIAHQRATGAAVVRACTQDGVGLDIYSIASSGEAEAALLLRGELREDIDEEGIEIEGYISKGYVNLLESPTDLRLLALDAFAEDNEIRPVGTEIKPGVWVGRRARVHRTARVLAPAFIGAGSHVCRAAVLTRGAVVEHHTFVDCGTVVENSTLLPYAAVGAGLDVTYSVVGFRHVSSLHREVTVEIGDPLLVGMTSASAPVRTLQDALNLVSYLPKALFNGFFPKRNERTIPDLPDSADEPASALAELPVHLSEEKATNNFSDYIPVRSYGKE